MDEMIILKTRDLAKVGFSENLFIFCFNSFIKLRMWLEADLKCTKKSTGHHNYFFEITLSNTCSRKAALQKLLGRQKKAKMRILFGKFSHSINSFCSFGVLTASEEHVLDHGARASK